MSFTVAEWLSQFLVVHSADSTCLEREGSDFYCSGHGRREAARHLQYDIPELPPISELQQQKTSSGFWVGLCTMCTFRESGALRSNIINKNKLLRRLCGRLHPEIAEALSQLPSNRSAGEAAHTKAKKDRCGPWNAHVPRRV